MIEQVFWSTVDKLDVINNISLANFLVGVAVTYIITMTKVSIGFCPVI